MKCIVTGGYGFIGSHLVRRLVKDGHTVVNIDKETYAANRDFLQDIETNYISGSELMHCNKYTGSFNDHKLTSLSLDIRTSYIQYYLREFKPDVFFHLAAESHVDNSIEDSEKFMQTNIMGTHSLLHYINETGNKTKFVHVSTDEVYGSIQDGYFTETTNYDPRSPYSASKAASDFLVKAWFNTYKTPAVITHCSNNYGPNQQIEKFIPTVITKALKSGAIPIYGSGKNVRDWLWVEDHVDALVRAGLNGKVGETYNIGGGVEMTNLSLANFICNQIPGMHYITHVEDRKGHDFRYAIDNTKITEELGWSPVKSFKEGISETIAWYKKWLETSKVSS